jgi:3-hydroxyisobutyrate dehydrogenase
MKAGFIGMGRLGKAMARRLIAEGVELVTWNRTPEKMIDLGTEIVDEPAQMPAKVEVIFLSLFDSSAVEAVLFGPDGLLQGDLSGRIVVDTTTNHFDKVGGFYAILRERGGTYLETPVLGSVVPAGQGALTILVGGDRDSAQKITPFLEKLAHTVFYFEEEGQATKMKLVNNLVLGSFMATLCEAVVLGEAVGIPRVKVLDILSSGAGNSGVLSAKKEKLTKEDFSPHFSVGLIHKDLRYLEDLAKKAEKPSLTAHAATELFALAVSRGMEEADFSGLYKILKDQAEGHKEG